MRISKWIALSLLLLGLAPNAQADLSELIARSRTEPAVVTAVPGTTSYGLLVLSGSDFAARVGLEDPLKLANSLITVVEDRSSDPLPLLDFDGGNMIYHLMLAHGRFEKLSRASGFPDPALGRKIVVRVRANSEAHPSLHFAREDHNNCGYYPADFRKRWGAEIWCNSRKSAFHRENLHGLVESAGMSAVSRNWISMGVMLPLQLFSRVNSGLDGSKIPSVIYHEAFHWATDADGFFPAKWEGNPVAEDFANYFGSSFQGRPEVAEIDEFSGRAYKRDYSRVREIKDTVPIPYNASAFGTSMLWWIRGLLGAGRADLLIWNSMRELRGSYRETDVPPALLRTAAAAGSEITAEERAKIEAQLQKYSQSYQNLEKKTGYYVEPKPKPTPMEDVSEDLIEIASRVEQVSAQVLESAATRQADLLRQIPDELNEEGLELAPDQVSRFRAVADALEADSVRPGFRSRVAEGMRKLGRIIGKGGLSALIGTGMAGNAIYALGSAPLALGRDFATALVSGRGIESQPRDPGQEVLSEEFLGAGGGLAAFYSTHVALDSLGYAFFNPASMIGLGAAAIKEFVCGGIDLRGTSVRARYCRRNEALNAFILRGTSKAGASAGLGIRKVFTGGRGGKDGPQN